MFFNHLRLESSEYHFVGVGVVYVTHGMGKYTRENHLGVIDTCARYLHICHHFLISAYRTTVIIQ